MRMDMTPCGSEKQQRDFTNNIKAGNFPVRLDRGEAKSTISS
jgi:hypothetical protein